MSELTPEEIEMFFLATWLNIGTGGRYFMFRSEYWGNDPRVHTKTGNLVPYCGLAYGDWLNWRKKKYGVPHDYETDT